MNQSTEVQPIAAKPEALTPLQMLDRAITAKAEPETLEKLMALHDRWLAAQAKRAFDFAIAAAKAELPVIVKDQLVDFTSPKGRTHYRHESLAQIARAIDQILAKHGLNYRFRTSSPVNAPIEVTCILSHRD